jgi:hypothetical protein
MVTHPFVVWWSDPPFHMLTLMLGAVSRLQPTFRSLP